MPNLKELALKVTDAMIDAGYSNVTAWRSYLDAFLPLIRFHAERGFLDYDPVVTADFCNQLQERRLGGSLNPGNARRMIAAVSRLRHYCDTGRIDYELPTKVSSFKLNSYYEGLLTDYISHNNMHPKTRSDLIWIARKFFSWLIANGHPTLENLTVAEIQAFMVHCSGHMASASIHNVQLYLRKLCCYLCECGIINNPYTALLSMKVSRESKLYPATTHGELAAIIGTIDMSSPKGKRDYAIILLGTILGFRAIDIIKLKLTNVNWRHGDITIVQSKTGNTVTLPLTADVGAALRDYILHGRRPADDDIVFQRHHAPFGPFRNAESIADMFDDYRKRAGLKREAFDGTSFHSLRRALGTNMVTAGVSVEDVAQTMGDEKIDSIKKYVKLDSPHLAECALDFKGIEIGVSAI
jgi:integrase